MAARPCRLDGEERDTTLPDEGAVHAGRVPAHPQLTTRGGARRRHGNTEVGLYVLAYNLERVMSMLGIARTMKAMRYKAQPLGGLPLGLPLALRKQNGLASCGS